MGAGGTDQFQGGSGNNTITGSGLNDVLQGNNGNDVITYNGGGTAYIMDGNGNDQITTTNGSNNYVQVGNGRDTINGGAAGNETIYTGSGNDNIVGGSGGGKNEIVAGGGNDIITAGTGSYLIEGGKGNDQIQGGSATCLIEGGSGTDIINGGSSAHDTIYAGTGGHNNITGSSGGYNLIYGGGQDDTITGGGGYDTIYASSGGNSQITGGPNGGNQIYGGGQGNTINGGSGGYNLIHGGGQGDAIIGGAGNDTVYASNGGNTLIYGGIGGGNLIFGGGNGDVLYGIYGKNTSFGVNGNNSTVEYGNNTIYAGSGNETLYGGDGLGLVFNPLANGLADAAGDFLSAGNNSLVGGSGRDVIYGDSTGNNTLVGGPGAFTVGSDASLTSETLYAGTGADTLQAGPGTDALYGGGGGDTFQLPFIPYGQAQPQDTIVGGAGINTLLLASSYLVPLPVWKGTVLYAPVSASSNSISVFNATGLAVNDVIQIDNEAMLVTAISSSSPSTLTVQRGYTLQQTGATTTASSATVTGLETLGLTKGEPVFGPANIIQPGTTITSIVSANAITLSLPAIGSGTNVTLGFGTTAASHSVGTTVGVPPASSGDFAMYFTQSAGKYQANLYDLDTLPPGTFSLSTLNKANSLGYITFGGTPLPSGAPGLPSGISQIDLQGGQANNWIQVDPSVTHNMYLYGGPGSNTLMAGSGNDTLIAGTGTAVLYGGSGEDLLYGSDTPAQEAANSSNPTDGNDTLIAGSGDTELFAGSGNDVLIGGSVARQVGSDGTPGLANLQGGQYQLLDGSGRDVLAGGSGNDLLIAGPGSPGAVLEAGSGDDVLVADNYGSNVLKGGTGATNLLVGGNLDNVIIGGSGSDTLAGGLGLNTLLAGAGTDVLYASYNAAAWTQAEAAAASWVQGTPGVHVVPPNIFQGDTLAAQIADLLILAQDQPLTLPQEQQLQADLGQEFTQLAAQENSLNNQVIQLLSLGLTGAPQQQLLTVLNADQAIQNEMVTLLSQLGATENVDSLIGGAGNDQLYGNPNPLAATFMAAGSGSDTFYNYNSPDTIIGGTGEDVLMFRGDGNMSLTKDPNGTDVDVAIPGQNLTQQFGTITNASSTITGLSSTSDLVVGEVVTGSGIPTTAQQGNTTNGNNTITGLTNTANLTVGETVTGAGIPFGTTIASIVSSSSITISNDATATATSLSLNFWDTTITHILSSSSIEISQNAVSASSPTTVTLTFSGVWDIPVAASNPNIHVSGIKVLGVTLGAGTDHVTANWDTAQSNSLPVSLYVQCGSGTDVVDASTFIAPETLLGGSGNDTIKIGAQLATGTNQATGDPNTFVQATAQTQTQLAVATTNTSATITVASAANIPVNTIIAIDQEDMLVTAVSENALTVTRGFNGTTEAYHSVNAVVFILPTQLSIPISDTNSTDTIDVLSGANIAANTVIQIDGEEMQVTSVSGDQLTVNRGFHGSGIAPHSAGATVFILNNAELDILDSISDSVTVSNGTLQIGGYTESLGHLVPFQKLVAIGGPGTNTFTTDGTIPNVVLEGGSGTNIFNVTGTTATLIGGVGANNTYNVPAHGNYTIIGGTSAATPATSGVNAPALSGTSPPSVVVNTPPASANGNVPISYTLIDGGSNPCSIQVQYSVAGGLWQVATSAPGGNGTSNLTSSPTGVNHTFIWNTTTDLGSTNNSSVQVRITPSDANDTGVTQASQSFAVDNGGVDALTIHDQNNYGETVHLAQNGTTTTFSTAYPQTAVFSHPFPGGVVVSGLGGFSPVPLSEMFAFLAG